MNTSSHHNTSISDQFFFPTPEVSNKKKRKMEANSRKEKKKRRSRNTNNKAKVISARKIIGPPCNQKCRRKCTNNFTNEDFIINRVEKLATKQQTKKAEASSLHDEESEFFEDTSTLKDGNEKIPDSKRKFSQRYRLAIGENDLQICKTMFLSQL